MSKDEPRIAVTTTEENKDRKKPVDLMFSLKVKFLLEPTSVCMAFFFFLKKIKTLRKSSLVPWLFPVVLLSKATTFLTYKPQSEVATAGTRPQGHRCLSTGLSLKAKYVPVK